MANKKYSDFSTGAGASDTMIILIANPTTGALEKLQLSDLKTYISGSGGGSGDTTPPTVTSKSVSASTANKIDLVFSESVTLNTSGWSAKKNGSAWTISSAAGSGTSYSFTMGSSASSGDTIVISYDSTTGSTVDGSGNELVTFTDASVVNNVAPPFLAFTTGSGTITQSPTGTWSGSSGAYMEATTSLASSTDGYIQCKIAGSSSEAFALGFDPTATQSNFPYPYYLFVYTGTYWWGDSSGGNNTSTSYAINDLLRLRRASGTLIGEKSSDGGSTWTTLHTWSTTSSAKLYCKIGYSGATSGTVATEIRGYNLT
jgi:hypothetical protein